MNLAIEYVIRRGIFQEMLNIPCAVFLNHIGTRSLPIVMTLQNCYGMSENAIIVKHWYLFRCEKTKIMPPCDEFTIDRSEILKTDKTIIPHYKTMEYFEDPFPPGEKQGAEPQMSASQAAEFCEMQELKYNSYMDNFFCTKKHEEKRQAWLWTCFMQSFLSTSYKQIFKGNAIEAQQSVISQSFPVIWKGWLMWNKHMFITANKGPAPELVFATSYFEKYGYPSSKGLYSKKKSQKFEIPIYAQAEAEVAL